MSESVDTRTEAEKIEALAKATNKPKHFDVDHYLDSVEQMICADEIERALWMIDNLPGYYRDQKPQRALEIRDRIFMQLMDVFEYSGDSDEQEPVFKKVALERVIDTDFTYPRGQMVSDLVRQLNERGLKPHIIEMGPASFWLPHGLINHGRTFTYEGHTINESASQFAKDKLKDVWSDERDPSRVNIFVCFETLEHLWNESDIYHWYLKLGISCEFVFLSTPLYTLFGGLPNWSTRQLGHLRTYTPKEFQTFAEKHWINRRWQFQIAPMMVLLGQRS